MANLQSLIKIRRHAVEEKQKALAALFREVEGLEEQKSILRDRLEKERQSLETNPVLEFFAYFGRFSYGVKRKIAAIDEEIAKTNVRIQILQDDMRVAFAELKRIEIVDGRRAAEDARAIKEKESRELDAIGIEGFRRKED